MTYFPLYQTTCFFIPLVAPCTPLLILLEQIRTIDKQRLQEYLGTLDGRFLVAVDKALAISVSLEKRIDKNV